MIIFKLVRNGIISAEL